jgi:tetratricopeptide (TPR) repeat protein
MPASPDAILEDIATQIPKRSGADVREQIQEVDFYIRLGFHDEARSKLNEIAAEFPDHPELAARFQKLGDAPPKETAAASAIALGPSVEPRDEPPAGEPMPEAPDSGSLSFQGEPEPPKPTPPAPPPVAAPPPAPPVAQLVPPASSPDSGVNRLFADLIDEVNALPDAQPSKETFETHFNMGTAYREMGLLDDAAREFQAAIGSLNQAVFPREFVQCCGMLSTCFVEKGMPRSAIRWCQSGLGIPGLSRHEEVALRYDLGMAYSLTGEPERALESFEFVFRIDPGYRDVAARIDSLKGRS